MKKSLAKRSLVLVTLLAVVCMVSISYAGDTSKTKAGGKVFVSPTLGAKFVLIPAGTFTMGEGEIGSDETRHQVTISKPFYMQTTEVTQWQWQKVMGSNPSHFSSCGNNCPVENVFWKDVQDFISRLNRQEGTDKYRLPTEAQWEYAARGGGKEEYADISSESNLGDYAWYDANSGSKTHPVGQKRPNGLGLYDMSGNVWEWVHDWYGEYPAGSVTDPEGPSSGGSRMARGCSWNNNSMFCRSANSIILHPGARDLNLGFRLLSTR